MRMKVIRATKTHLIKAPPSSKRLKATPVLCISVKLRNGNRLKDSPKNKCEEIKNLEI